MIAPWPLSRRPSLTGISFAVAVAVVLGGNIPGHAAFMVGLGGGMLAGACLRVGLGIALLSGVEIAPELRFLTGLVVLAYVLAVPVYLLGTPIAAGALCFLLIALIPTPPIRANVHCDRRYFAFFTCVAAATGFALIWSHETSQRWDDFAQTGIFRLWTDFFIHAGAIAEFGDLRTIGRASAELADIPDSLYHFVSFAVPGLAVRLTDLSPMESVTGVWLPVGILATALGVLGLGRAIAGLGGGALSLLFLAAVPDAASYGLHQGFLSLHWMLETAPGSLYGLPCACASIAFLVDWSRQKSWPSLVISGLLLGAIFLLRAHIFIWFAAPWAATCIAGMPTLAIRWKAALLAGGVVAAVAGMLLVAHELITHEGLLAYSAKYIEFLNANVTPTSYEGLYQGLISRFGRAGALGPGLLLAYAGMGGLPLLTFLVGNWLVWRRHQLESFDFLPCALLVWSGILMLLAPIPYHGDFSDFRQRGFVLVVVTLYCWNARWLVMLLPQTTSPLPLALAACLGLVVTNAQVSYWKAPHMAWADSFRSHHVPPDLIAAASWLRAHSGPKTVFTIATPDPAANLIDDATVLMGLSGSAAWLSRPAIHREAGGRRAAATLNREEILSAVAGAPTRDAAMQPLRTARVSFYIVNGPEAPVWDPSYAGAAFHAGTVAIYRVEPTKATP